MLVAGSLLAIGVPASSGPGQRAPALVLHLDGVIGPASADYFSRALADAADRRVPVVILRIDTPGGLDTSMRAMIRDILASSVPIATYVSPSGARAASAGTFILYASHIAAMAPGTNLGAATPVQIGGLPAPAGTRPAEAGDDRADKDGKPATAPPASSPMEAKAVNDAVAYIRALAELRGRNAEWGELAVREAASLSAGAALKQGVIDIQAATIGDLLSQLHGRVIEAGGRQVTLNTRGLSVQDVRPDWRTNLLNAITNPNVALILIMAGIYGLIFEFMTPGSIAPGTIGAICLLTGLYALAALPVNFAGLALLVLGMGLLVAEAYAASFGVLGVSGAIAIGLGALILFDTDIPHFRIALPVIAGVVTASVIFALLVTRLALLSRRRPVVSGREEMIGARGVVHDWLDGGGHVFAHGERWNATGAAQLQPGQPIRVTAVHGLTLAVEPDPPATEG